MTTPTRPKRAAKRGREVKPATEGEKIVLRHLFNIRHDDPHYDQFLDDVRQPQTHDLDRIRDAACARAIDAAIRRAVRERDRLIVPEVIGAVRSIERCGVVGKCNVCEATRSSIKAKYGVTIQ